MFRALLFIAGLFLNVQSFSQDTTRLSLLFVGDIMQHDSNIAAAYNPFSARYDYTSCFEYVAPILKSADLTIGNLELTLAGKPYKGYPQFSAPNELAYELKRVGFDVLVTANNHSVDRGKKGIERTIDVLDTLSMLHTGTFKDSMARATNYPLVIEKNGFRLSLLNYTYATNGIPVPRPTIVNLIDTLQIKTDLAKARSQNSDAIIVFMHWGDEYQSLPNKTQKKLTELCFREGAKLVIGAHPHVLQPMEWRKEKDQFVAYSLGNFISGQRPRYRDGGAMLWIDLNKQTKDSLSVTSIDNARYELEWVQKSNDARKEFVIMPFRYFEADTTFMNDRLLQQSFEVFKKDSRALYSKHNMNVREMIQEKLPDSVRYAVCLGSFSEEVSNAIMEKAELKTYPLFKVPHGNESFLLYAGKFSSRAAAEELMAEILTDTSFKRVHIARHVEVEQSIQPASGNE
jgi:poly-gamma-glutamate capsule biosynthesis protein CapA/YwtB (metallophosphatase superfamily)